MKRIVYALLLLLCVSLQAQEISIIPKPAEMQIEEGEFSFNGKVVLCYPKIKDCGIDAKQYLVFTKYSTLPFVSSLKVKPQAPA